MDNEIFDTAGYSGDWRYIKKLRPESGEGLRRRDDSTPPSSVRDSKFYSWPGEERSCSSMDEILRGHDARRPNNKQMACYIQKDISTRTHVVCMKADTTKHPHLDTEHDLNQALFFQYAHNTKLVLQCRKNVWLQYNVLPC